MLITLSKKRQKHHETVLDMNPFLHRYVPYKGEQNEHPNQKQTQ